MAKGKGEGPAAIIAIAILSTAFVIILDHYGLTTWLKNIIQKVGKGK